MNRIKNTEHGVEVKKLQKELVDGGNCGRGTVGDFIVIPKGTFFSAVFAFVQVVLVRVSASSLDDRSYLVLIR